MTTIALSDLISQHLTTLGASADEVRREIELLIAQHPFLTATELDHDIAHLAQNYDIVDEWLRARGSSFNAMFSFARPNNHCEPTHEEFVSARESVLEILQHLGNHDSFGNGDFYLLDDRVSSFQLLLEVQNPECLGQAAIAQLSELLSLRLIGWQLVIRRMEMEDVVLGSNNSDPVTNAQA